MDNEDSRPKWLLELENRKRKPRLAHEIGAGAPCLKCEGVCPGLDLHFWRKICKNCKCSRDDHDVPDDEFPQFNLLLGSSGKSRRKFIVLKLNNQHIDSEETFEWAPPDTSKELAADYMKALPEEKLPIKGSSGAALRKQQLQKQLPLHDIDHKVCDELSDSERKQFEKYLENLKKYVGQGKVSKIMGARPFDRSLMTPSNVSECLTPKHHQVSEIINQPSPNLRTPSSFAPKLPYSLVPRSLPKTHDQLLDTNEKQLSLNDTNVNPGRLENIRVPYLNEVENTPVKLGRYHHVLENIKNNSKNVAESKNIIGGVHYTNSNSIPANKLYYDQSQTNKKDDLINKITDDGQNPIEMCQSTQLESNKNDNLILSFNRDGDLMENIAQSNLYSDNSRNIDKFLLPSKMQELGDIAADQIKAKHSNQSQNSTMSNKILPNTLWPCSSTSNTDIIGSTLDEKELSNIREKLTAKYSATNEPVELLNREGHNNPLISSDLRRNNIHENNRHNPLNANTNLIAAQAQMNYYKNPKQTIICSEKLEYPIFPNEIVGRSSSMPIDNLEAILNNLSMDPSKESKIQKCHKCGEGIHIGDVVVTADKATDAVWHPGCFVCCTCDELLVDLVYFYYKNKLYCARDLASLMEIPRCFACDELIFVREYTVAEGHNYHVKHFCCWDCDVPLAGKQYISENDRPLCLQCYQKTYAKLCNTCNKLIAADQQGVAVKNLNFHATDECFCCYNCKKTLLSGRMAIKKDRPFCSKECIQTFLNENL